MRRRPADIFIFITHYHLTQYGLFMLSSCPARCDYISTLSHVTSSGYTDAEFWIGRKASDLPSEFISLAEADLQLYQHLILPREYSNYTKYWDSHQPWGVWRNNIDSAAEDRVLHHHTWERTNSTPLDVEQFSYNKGILEVPMVCISCIVCYTMLYEEQVILSSSYD